MRADVESCRAAGFMEHLTKPIKFDDLRSAIDRVCGGVLVNPPASTGAGAAPSIAPSQRA
jgi:hypothetical protein